MKKSSLVFLLSVAILISFSACSEDKESTSPVFDELTLTPNPVYTGQYVKGVVSYISTGDYIYSSDYQYTIGGVGSVAWTEVSPTKSQPQFTFKAPTTAGTYTITFKTTKIRYSATGKNGELYGSSNTVTQQLKVKNADVIDACWNDSKSTLKELLLINDSANALVWKGKIQVAEKTSADSINASRVYEFSNDKLSKVTMTAYKDFITRRTYNDRTSSYENDSIIYNYPSFAILNGMTSASFLKDFDDEGETPTLTGEYADVYPVSSWADLTSKQQTEVVVAFWKGKLDKYTQTVYSSTTKCVCEAYCEGDRMIYKWTFEPL